MKGLILGSLVVLSSAVVLFAQVDPADKILVAKPITEAQAAQFSVTDGAASAFWASWDGDYISMNSADPLYARSRSATSPFSGADDAAMIIRAAYDATGMYLYFQVTDNSWVDPSIWSNDNVDIYVDAKSSAAIVDQLNWFNPTQWALTFTSKQLQVPMGATAPVTSWNYRYYSELDVNMMDYPTAINDATLGILMEVSGTGTVKIQEWFLPWAQYGVTEAVAVGQKYGFTVNYNDMDAADGAEVNSLSWIQLCDPYCLPDATLWGDIQLGDGVISAKPFAANRVNLTRNSAVRTDLYTVRGEKVSGMAKASSLVVKRQILANGTQKAVMGLAR